jgi:uncharacterized protein (DUF302 family)
MTTLRYGFEKRLRDTTFDQAIASVTATLKVEGFGVLTEIDVQATMKKKLDVDLRRYVILGACNPRLAHQALVAEPQIGLLLPCNVVVQEAPGGDVLVSIANSRALFQLVDNPAAASIAAEADERRGSRRAPRPRAGRDRWAPNVLRSSAGRSPQRRPLVVPPTQSHHVVR